MFDGYHGDRTAPFALGLAAVLAVVLGVRGAKWAFHGRFVAVMGTVALLASIFGGHSFLWTLPLALLAVAVPARIVEKRFAGPPRVSGGMVFAAGALGAVALSDLAYESLITGLDPRGAISGFLATLFSPFVTRLDSGHGVSSVSDGHAAFLQLNFDRLGGAHFFALAFLILAISAFRRRKILDACLDLGALLVYAPFVGHLHLQTYAGNPEHSWTSETAWMLAYVPLAIWLAVRAATSRSAEVRSQPGWALACAAVGSLLLVTGYSAWGPSGLKPGRIVMDEAHGDWETSKVPLDSKTFGGYTAYNYRNLFEELERVFGAERTERELTREELRGVSVLILKTPTTPYSDKFRDAVVDFVHSGGGLWLVGDHTDAFGMSTHLNKIGNRLGVEFQKNAWFEPPVKRNLWEPNAFTDPVARDLGAFLFYTGCELSAPWTDKKLMVSRRNIIEDADYSAGSFFGALRSVSENNGGNVAMATLGQRGRGRMAMWSDSTLYSNFAIYSPGKLEIAFNTVEWLRRENSFPLFRSLLMLVGGALVVAGAVRLNGAVLLTCVFVATASLPFVERTNRAGTRVWKPEECLSGRLVAFYEPHKSPHLPVYASIDRADDYFYLSSFMSVQRIGARPFFASTVDQAVKAESIVVIPITNPTKNEEVDRLVDWTAKGGNLIVLDGGNDGGYLVNRLFEKRGAKSPLARWKPPVKAQRVVDLKDRSLGDHRCLPLEDCRSPVLSTKDGKPIAGWYPFGQGRVFISNTLAAFSDNATGYVLDRPTKTQFGVLHTLFGVYETALAAKPETVSKRP